MTAPKQADRIAVLEWQVATLNAKVGFLVDKLTALGEPPESHVPDPRHPHLTALK